MASTVNRRRLVSILAWLPFFPALFRRKLCLRPATEYGVYHYGMFCALCSGVSELLHKRGPWTAEECARINAITEAKAPAEALRATTGYMRHILGNPETARVLASRGLNVDFERVLAAMADEQLQLHFAGSGAFHG